MWILASGRFSPQGDWEGELEDKKPAIFVEDILRLKFGWKIKIFILYFTLKLKIKAI